MSEPKPFVVTRITKRLSPIVLDSVDKVILDWLILGWECSQLPDGRWKIEITLAESDVDDFRPFTQCGSLGGGPFEALQVHQQMPLWTAIRLAWWLLWSTGG